MRVSLKSADLSGLTSRCEGAMEAALGIVAENVLADCTPYVPYETGALRGSGRAAAKAGVGTVSWGGDADTAQYARAQYYGAYDHSTSQNAIFAPKARGHWFEGAKAERKGAWCDMFAQEYGRRLHG